MAQTIFVNITVGKSLIKEGDIRHHDGGRGASASGDITVSIDTTNVKTITQIEFALRRAIVILKGGTEFTL
jgi:hypothetical protein